MKKFYPLVALILVISAAGLYGLDYYKKLRLHQREQVSYLLSRCVNQSLLSLFRLQANDWKKNPGFYQQEADTLAAEVAALPEIVLDGKMFGEWQAAEEICDRLTKNTNRHHRTIFRPLGYMAKTGLWELERLQDPGTLDRRKKAIYRVEVAAQAAGAYLHDFSSDIQGLLQASTLSTVTRTAAMNEIEQTILSGYRAGSFSLRPVTQYLERQQHFYQLLADNTRGYRVRGGSLYFYDSQLRRQVDDLNRALVSGEVDFYNHWRQIATR